LHTTRLQEAYDSDDGDDGGGEVEETEQEGSKSGA